LIKTNLTNGEKNMSKICFLAGFITIGAIGSSFAQINPAHVGSFNIYVAGTSGSHRGNIHYGTVTVFSNGSIQGTVRDYDRGGAREQVTGSMTLATGAGSVRVGADTIGLRKFKSRNTIVMTGEYFKGSSGGGVVGGIR